MSTNVLISSSGRQVYLIKAFKEALLGKGLVYASDLDINARSLVTADKGFKAPPFTSSGYIEWMLKVCESNDIKLLLTLSVEELLILEKSRERFHNIGCTLLGGRHDSIMETYDKYQLSKLCHDLGIRSPITYRLEDIQNNHDLEYPILAKPQFGRGSRGHKLIQNVKELEAFTNSLNGEPYIFQQFIAGQEYGFDIINDLNSEFAGILARKKISMKNGETYEAVTVDPNSWIVFGEKLSRRLMHTGTIDVDALLYNDELYLIDINYRFGGGYIFSHAAGANIPSAYISWLSKDNNAVKYITSEFDIHTRRIGEWVELINTIKCE